jgi:hypothetical protein
VRRRSFIVRAGDAAKVTSDEGGGGEYGDNSRSRPISSALNFPL